MTRIERHIHAQRCWMTNCWRTKFCCSGVKLESTEKRSNQGVGEMTQNSTDLELPKWVQQPAISLKDGNTYLRWTRGIGEEDRGTNWSGSISMNAVKNLPFIDAYKETVFDRTLISLEVSAEKNGHSLSTCPKDCQRERKPADPGNFNCKVWIVKLLRWEWGPDVNWITGVG